MHFILNDGGRAMAGYKGNAGDCVVRAVAIATGQDYEMVYKALADVNASTRRTPRRSKAAGRRSARSGVFVKTAAFKRYMTGLGWKFVATMGIGTGCTTHLHDGELPMGRLIVSVSRHYTAVIDGVIHDTHDPQRELHCVERDTGRDLKPGEWRNSNGICSIRRRCVYGYWVKADRHALTV